MRVDHARKTVRDNQCCPAFHQPVQSLLYDRLVLRINAGERFVEHQNRRILEQSASDGDTLPLTAGESGAALADESFVALGQRTNKIVRVGGAGGGFDFLLRRLGLGKAQVLRHGAVEKISVLSDHCDMTAQKTEGQIAQVSTAKKDTALLRIDETEHQ